MVSTESHFLVQIFLLKTNRAGYCQSHCELCRPWQMDLIPLLGWELQILKLLSSLIHLNPPFSRGSCHSKIIGSDGQEYIEFVE